MEGWADTCLVCGNKFFSEADLSRHIKSVHAVSSHPAHLTPEKILLHDCPFCPFQHENCDELEKHVQSIHSSELYTPTKDKKGIGKGQLDHSDVNGGTTLKNSSNSSRGASADDGYVREKSSCPICGSSEFITSDDLHAHVESHFSSDFQSCSNDDNIPQSTADELIAIRLQQQENYNQSCQSKKSAEDFYFQQLQDQYGMGERHKGKGFRKQAIENMEKRVGRGLSAFDYYNQKFTMLEKLESGIDDGLTVTPDLLEHLRKHFEQTCKPDVKVWLCSSTEHIGRGPGDSGWGCGFRNIQMMLSCLIKHPRYSENMKCEINGQIPSIPKLQHMIEQAWKQGYDVHGREQLESKLVGTRKWIGATEAFSLLASLKLHCRIIDFPRYSGPSKSHPLLYEWIHQYFQDSNKISDSRGIVICDRPPLYVQHEGHSRTIVGIICETTSKASIKRSDTLNPIKFIQFDPGHSKYQLWKRPSNKKKNGGKDLPKSLALHLLVKPMSKLNESQYQIVIVEGIANPQRILQQKNVDTMSEKVQ